MTSAQNTMLFSLFAKLAKACARKTADERDRLRAEITMELFGEARSWADFGNADVDRMKRRIVAMLKPNDIIAQMADSDEGADAAERERLVHGIEEDMRRAGFAEEYVEHLSRDAHDRADWRGLPLPRLRALRLTVANRRRTPLARRTRRVEVVPDRHA